MNSSTFAKMCGVKKRTLFHYDDIGLLKPAFVRENGYREYTVEQLGMMDMIKIFQTCGYSLSEIRELCGMDAPERQRSAEDALNRIEERIRQLQQMKDYLQSKQRLLEEYCTLPPGKYRIQDISIRYDRKPVGVESHFFSFLRDGTDSVLLLDESGEIWFCRRSEAGACESRGEAVSFFLEIPSESPDLNVRIRQTLEQFPVFCKPPYFVEILPHFLMENQNTAWIRVTAMCAMADEA